jgi:hypothetical protein
LTEKVAATPKSLFDCITAGDSPARSSASITWCQRVPPWTRKARVARSGSQRAMSKVMAKPLRGRLCPPIEWRAAPRATGRRWLAAPFNSPRRAAMSFSSESGLMTQWRNTGVGDRRLASFMTTRCWAAGMRGSSVPAAMADEASSRHRRFRSIIPLSPFLRPNVHAHRRTPGDLGKARRSCARQSSVCGELLERMRPRAANPRPKKRANQVNKGRLPTR